jgi:hypothetical protein
MPSLDGIKSEAEFIAYVDKFRQDIDLKFIKPLSQVLAGAFPVDNATSEFSCQFNHSERANPAEAPIKQAAHSNVSNREPQPRIRIATIGWF